MFWFITFSRFLLIRAICSTSVLSISVVNSWDNTIRVNHLWFRLFKFTSSGPRFYLCGFNDLIWSQSLRNKTISEFFLLFATYVRYISPTCSRLFISAISEESRPKLWKDELLAVATLDSSKACMLTSSNLPNL